MSENREQLAWLAGFYEGEGNVNGAIYDRGDHYARTIRFNVDQQDESQFSLLKAKKIIMGLGVPENHITFDMNKRSKCWKLRVNRFEDVEKIYLAIWEWLSPRRKAQVQEAFIVYCEEFAEFKAANSSNRYKERQSSICDLPIMDTFPEG